MKAQSIPEWDKELEKRGIEVINNVLTDEALVVYRAFAASGALVYNAGGGGRSKLVDAAS